jgi:hypothetical protein
LPRRRNCLRYKCFHMLAALQTRLLAGCIRANRPTLLPVRHAICTVCLKANGLIRLSRTVYSKWWKRGIREPLVKAVGTHATASLINLLGGRLGRSGMRPYQPLANAAVEMRSEIERGGCITDK